MKRDITVFANSPLFVLISVLISNIFSCRYACTTLD